MAAVNVEDLDKYDEDHSDLEDFEMRPRTFDEGPDVVQTLPIKDATGAWRTQVRVVEKKEEIQQDLPPAPKPKQDSMMKKEATDYQKLTETEKKNKLASIATCVMEDPQEHIEKLKVFRLFNLDSNPEIVKLSIMTQLAVYKDIIPGYYIRKLSEKELKVKVSKEVKKMREYEQTLLRHYQHYLQTLDGLSKKKDNKVLMCIAVKCLCEMLSSAHHFNLRLNLLTAIVGKMNDSTIFKGQTIGERCCICIEELFQNDQQGYITLEAVKTISRLVKTAKYYRIKPRVLEVFLQLKLSADIKKMEETKKQKLKKKDRVHLSKKQRKLRKIQEEAKQELKEAEAVVDKEEKLKLQTETLEHIFVAYFRVLKHAPDSPLLEPVLKGISKFGNLISIDYFNDIVETLKTILKNVDLEPIVQMECVFAAFTLLNYQQNLIPTDLKHFYDRAYSILKQLDFNNRDTDEQVRIIRRIKNLVRLMFNKQDVNVVRVAAFAKRICGLMLDLEPEVIVEFLGPISELARCSPKTIRGMIEEDDEEFSGGDYRADIDEPDMCNAQNARLDELLFLKKHKSTQVREIVSKLIKMLK